MPDLVIIAGPNGAGKSTLAPRLLERFHVREFVNADVIAAGLSAFAPESVAFEAGRAMVARLRTLAGLRAGFAFETTLASRSLAPWVARLRRASGYRFHLVFVWVPDPAQSIERVAIRVRLGGHDVPAATIKRRYTRGLANFRRLYRPIADTWAVYDNSTRARLVAHGNSAGGLEILDAGVWTMIERSAQAKERESRYGAERRDDGMLGVSFKELTAVLEEASCDAWRRHKALGQPIAIWKDGEVVILPSDQIVV